MTQRDLLTIAEAAGALNLSGPRVHQLLASAELDGVELPPGRKRHAPGVPRVTAASVERFRLEREVDDREKGAGRGARPATRRSGVTGGVAGTVTSGPTRGDAVLGSVPGGDATAARAAAQELKIQMDALRAEVRRERTRNGRLLELAASLIELLRDSSTSAERLDDVADGYSAALTQLLSPDVPPEDM